MFNFTFHEFVNNKKNCKTIKCVSSYEGKTVQAVAEVHPDDEYNYEFGRKIAEKRCTVKLCDRKIKRFKRKQRQIDNDIEWYENQIKKLRKRKEAYKKTVCDTEVQRCEAEAALNRLLKD